MTPLKGLSEKVQAWVYFNYHHAREHGWEPFQAYQIIKERTTEFYKKPASLLYRGKWIYEGSVSELQPYGKILSLEDAVSLSFQRWSPSLQIGTRPDLYVEFETNYMKHQTFLQRIRSKL
jgi:hypothetical protein